MSLTLSWSVFLFTAAYCWMDLVARTRSASYRKLAAAEDKAGVRWRYVVLGIAGLVGAGLVPLLVVAG